MSGHISNVGKPVERVSVSYEPHEKYQNLAPFTNEKIYPGIPLLTSVPGGKIIEKDITYHSVLCPACKVEVQYDESSEPVCPECGIICAGSDTILSEQMVRDAKAAGRIEGESEG